MRAMFWLATVALVANLCALPGRRIAVHVDRDVNFALDVWSEDSQRDVVVRERDLGRLMLAGVAFEIIDPDIDASARAEAERIRNAKPGDWFADYKNLEQIDARLKTLALARPDLASVEVIGGSLEGRPLRALRIGKGGKKMLINGTQHAREWIATMVTTCVADRLITEYDTDARVKAFVDTTEVVVVPVVNPDGYQFSWGTDRYWRKNRRDRHGVDLNRNFDIAWGGRGSSDKKRSEFYRGAYAFSEPESQAIRDLAKREQFVASVDFHTFGQIVMHPWCHTSSRSPDDARFRAVGDRIASAIYAAHDNAYRMNQCGGASGTLMDWMYAETKALSFIIELRPRSGAGYGGFVLPPEQIRPTCDEGFAAVLELRKAL